MSKHESHSDPNKYTDPELRDKIKAEVMAGDKGGKPGQWSARKAQLVATEYEHAGGGFKGGPDASQKSLQKWGDEKWHTADGGKAQHEDGTTSRYLPDAAWNELSEKEKAETNRKKEEGSKKGKQFIANTEKAKEARKHATEGNAPARKKAATKGPAKKAASKTATKKTGGAKKAPAKKTAAKSKTPAKKTAAKSST